MPDATKKLFRAKADELKEEYYEKMATFFVAGGVVKGVCRTEKKEAKDKKNGKGSAMDRKEARAASGRPKKPPPSYWIWLGDVPTPRAQAGGKGKEAYKNALQKWKATDKAAPKSEPKAKGSMPKAKGKAAPKSEPKAKGKAKAKAEPKSGSKRPAAAAKEKAAKAKARR